MGTWRITNFHSEPSWSMTWTALVSNTLWVMVATFNHASQTWTQPVQVGTGIDDHGSPALTCDSDGYLHIVFGPHGSQPFHYYRSRLPNDSSQWDYQGGFGVKTTYPSLVCDDEDTLHIIYRSSRSSQPLELTYQRLPKAGSWSEPRVLARNNHSYDAHLLIAPDNTLHIGYHVYHTKPNYKVGHMTSADRGDTWTLADGSPLDLPVVYEDNVYFATEDTRQLIGMAVDSQGHPWINVEVASTRKARIYHYDGQQWSSFVADDRMPPGVELQGGDTHYLSRPLSFDSQDRLYMMAMTVEKEVVAYSDDQGRTFSVLDVYPRAKGGPKIRHSIERPTGHHSVDIPWLMFVPDEQESAKLRAVRLSYGSENN